MRDRIVLATRGSALALAQANHVADAFRGAWPGLTVELLVVRTQGDAITDRSIAEIGQGVFVGEVRQAVLDGRADIAVVPASANRGAIVPDHELEPVGIKAATIPAGCTPEGWLDIGEPPPGYSGYVFPGNNYHVFDYALFWANIRADAERRTRSFLKR